MAEFVGQPTVAISEDINVTIHVNFFDAIYEILLLLRECCIISKFVLYYSTNQSKRDCKSSIKIIPRLQDDCV